MDLGRGRDGVRAGAGQDQGDEPGAALRGAPQRDKLQDMRLVLAEKPSVARDLARVLGVRSKHQGWLGGGELAITWAVGHLAELEEPGHYDGRYKHWRLEDLPILPDEFALRPRKDALDQWRVVRRLLRDPEVHEVVNACDAGREGEHIFRTCYELAGCRAPVLRLWVSSMTDQALSQAWSRLRPGADFDALADAARCRSEADWLVGLNATRAMTLRARSVGGNDLFSLGRVQTPTLAMIVARDRAIEDFDPEDFWQVRADFSVGDARWRGTWFQARGPEERRTDDAPRVAPKAERLAVEAHAQALAQAVRGRDGTIERAERRAKRVPPPLLYDLTSLQRRANQRYGFAADRTLRVTQALYEKHKLLTYPRTDARYLTPDQVPMLPDVVRAVGTLGPYAATAHGLLASPIRPGKRVVNAAEVGDHHAIIPTSRAPRPGALSADEKRVYDLVARRFLAALSPHAVEESTLLVVAVHVEAELPEEISVPPRFRARGKVVVEPGWRSIDPPPTRKEVQLPLVPDGAQAHVEGSKVHQGQTRPPNPYNDASLLKSMETAGRDLDDVELKRAMRASGLGTPATRAAMIQTLITRRYVVRRGKELRATDKGRAVIDAVPVEALKSAELTGAWEARLARMAEGSGERQRFMADAREYARVVVGALAAAEPPPASVSEARPQGEPLGECPICGTPVTEGKGAYSCAKGRACTFVVFKSIAKRSVSKRMLKELLENGRTARTYKGFRSKKGKPFEAGLRLDSDGRVQLWFPDWRDPPAQPPPQPETPVGMPCPACGQGRVIAGRAAWGCSRWREGCGWRLSFEDDAGHRRSEADAARLVRGA